jgi:hypothetical protein
MTEEMSQVILHLTKATVDLAWKVDRIERALQRLVEDGHNPVSSAKDARKILDGEE